MKNIFTCICIGVCVALLSTAATAQKLRPVQMKVKSDLSKEVELQYKRAQEEWKRKLKNKDGRACKGKRIYTWRKYIQI